MIAFLMTWLYFIDFQISLSDDSFILICYFFEVLFLRKRAYALSVCSVLWYAARACDKTAFEPLAGNLKIIRY